LNCSVWDIASSRDLLSNQFSRNNQNFKVKLLFSISEIFYAG
jgi:hypothetical protein